jgi:(E)-4-hydroxy-3-methylbut-2-enyl-diphosphate synthase
VADLESKLNSRRLKTCIAPITVAVMGCEVNGPGEAREADIGIAAGKGSGVLFINGKIVKRVKEKDFTSALVKEIKKFK